MSPLADGTQDRAPARDSPRRGANLKGIGAGTRGAAVRFSFSARLAFQRGERAPIRRVRADAASARKHTRTASASHALRRLNAGPAAAASRVAIRWRPWCRSSSGSSRSWPPRRPRLQAPSAASPFGQGDSRDAGLVADPHPRSLRAAGSGGEGLLHLRQHESRPEPGRRTQGGRRLSDARPRGLGRAHHRVAVPAGHWARETVWAPEVHRYKGRYYLFVTLTSSDPLPTPEGRPPNVKRGTEILVADRPTGRSRRSAQARRRRTTGWRSTARSTSRTACRTWCSATSGSRSTTAAWTVRSTPIFARRGHADDAVPCHGRAVDALPRRPRRAVPRQAAITPRSRTGRGSTARGPAGWSCSGAVTGRPSTPSASRPSSSGRLAGPWVHHPEPLWKDDGGHPMLFHYVRRPPGDGDPPAEPARRARAVLRDGRQRRSPEDASAGSAVPDDPSDHPDETRGFAIVVGVTASASPPRGPRPRPRRRPPIRGSRSSSPRFRRSA